MNPVYSKSKVTVSVGLHTHRKGGMMISSDIELSKILKYSLINYVLLFKEGWLDRQEIWGVMRERPHYTEEGLLNCKCRYERLRYGEMSPTVDWSHASKAINLAIITSLSASIQQLLAVLNLYIVKLFKFLFTSSKSD